MNHLISYCQFVNLWDNHYRINILKMWGMFLFFLVCTDALRIIFPTYNLRSKLDSTSSLLTLIYFNSHQT